MSTSNLLQPCEVRGFWAGCMFSRGSIFLFHRSGLHLPPPERRILLSVSFTLSFCCMSCTFCRGLLPRRKSVNYDSKRKSKERAGREGRKSCWRESTSSLTSVLCVCDLCVHARVEREGLGMKKRKGVGESNFVADVSLMRICACNPIASSQLCRRSLMCACACNLIVWRDFWKKRSNIEVTMKDSLAAACFHADVSVMFACARYLCKEIRYLLCEIACKFICECVLKNDFLMFESSTLCTSRQTMCTIDY